MHMSTALFIPDSAPFTAEQRAWLNGYLAGLAARHNATLGTPHPTSPAQPLAILYASQTGTSEALAKKAAKTASSRGFAPVVLDATSVSVETLQKQSNLLLIASTYGDGEPPDGAKALHAELAADAGPALATMRYSVCALGDTNYTHFCQAGKDFDSYLEKRGATRVHPRADCDTDYETTFDHWLDAALSAFGAGSAPMADISNIKSEISNDTAYSKSRPYLAPVLAVRALNGAGSAKEVNHIEFDLSSGGPSLAYEAGDALGVIPHNDPELVASVLAALGADGEEAVATKVGELPLRRALTEYHDLGKPTPALLDLLGLAAITPPPHHVIDALTLRASAITNLKSEITPAAFTRALKPLAPRLYSISSSPKAHPGQVHLTVGAVRYELHGRARKGVCSTFLADRALALGSVSVFIHANQAFRPPSDPALPMIMVGPGTGIAPFRAFLQERAATRAPGKNWLFFGDQKAATDFLYADELHALLAAGVLARLDLAFSRDQSEKLYVQHRMLENASELWTWLEQGAHFYVCGDASRMAKDVDAALHQVIERAGGKSPAAAAAYVQALKTAKRYQRDVY